MMQGSGLKLKLKSQVYCLDDHFVHDSCILKLMSVIYFMVCLLQDH